MGSAGYQKVCYRMKYYYKKTKKVIAFILNNGILIKGVQIKCLGEEQGSDTYL